jgi:poly(A) polymerase
LHSVIDESTTRTGVLVILKWNGSQLQQSHPEDSGRDHPPVPGNDFLAGLDPIPQPGGAADSKRGSSKSPKSRKRRRTETPEAPSESTLDRAALEAVSMEQKSTNSKSEDPSSEIPQPRILERGDHGVSRNKIDRDALRALYRLIDEGHVAYLVGGAVRDLMIGKTPKDFDIATDATPRKVKRIFRNCRLIGRRFRLAHLHYRDGKILEVATFRSSGEADEVVRDGEMIHRDNVFGTPGEDSHRRDLTINGLFYDVSNFTVIDYVGGVKDLRDGVVRMIGDPDRSFHEDPVRMLRAIRHSGRTGFQLSGETVAAMERCRGQILKANPARLLEEFYKDLGSGHARNYFQTLQQLGYLDLLMPVVGDWMEESQGLVPWLEALDRLDGLVAAGQRVHQAMGITALIAPELLSHLDTLIHRKSSSTHLPKSVREGISRVLRQLKVYRRDEDRLRKGLGSLALAHRCTEEGRWSREAENSPWARDSIEILFILLGPGDGRAELLEQARSFPEAELPPPRVRRRRPGRSQGARPDGSGSSSTPSTTEGPSSDRPKKRRRRPRRRSSGPSEG